VAVDNASTDDSRTRLEEFAGRAPFPLHRIDNDRNLGFAAAANQGIRLASSPFVFLLNPDVRLRPETLETLSGSLDLAPSDVAAAGGKLLRCEGDGLAPTTLLDSTGIVVTRSGRHFDRGAGEPDRGQYDALGEVFGITGAAVLFRKEALAGAAVDGEIFDEDFFAFREDADLAWRLRGFGFRALYDPDAVAYHRRTVTPERRASLSKEVNFHSVKNRFLLRIHHADAGWLLRFGASAILRDLVVLGACLTIEWSSLPAFGWLLRNLPRHLRRRREILARRRVSSAALREWFA
jgi:GT2 family glycosyltransferase